jgi:hypothetical protein
MTIAFPRLARAGAHSPEQPLESAEMPQLTAEQQTELHQDWAGALQTLVDAAETCDDQKVRDFVLHKVGTENGLITATRVYDDFDDSWLPQALQTHFGYTITAREAPSSYDNRPGQPAYLHIVTRPEIVPLARPSHVVLHALGDEALQALRLFHL